MLKDTSHKKRVKNRKTEGKSKDREKHDRQNGGKGELLQKKGSKDVLFAKGMVDGEKGAESEGRMHQGEEIMLIRKGMSNPERQGPEVKNDVPKNARKAVLTGRKNSCPNGKKERGIFLEGGNGLKLFGEKAHGGGKEQNPWTCALDTNTIPIGNGERPNVKKRWRGIIRRWAWLEENRSPRRK